MTSTTPDPETCSIRRDDEHLLEWLLSGLPEEHREILVLREIEDMDYREIATVANVPIGTVMSLLARTLAALKVRRLQECPGKPHAVR
jgi:RNA polymerase sigma factor (sigma-70 family)